MSQTQTLLKPSSQFVTNANLLTHRCDQCTKKCQKCDRKLPVCSQCLKSKLSCTFTRIVKRSKRNSKFDEKVFVFSMALDKPNSSTHGKDSSKLLESGQLDYILPSLLLPSANFMSQRTLDSEIYRLVPRKNVLENLRTLLQYPSISNSNPRGNAFIGISKMLTMRSKQFSKTVEPQPLNLADDDLGRILGRSVKCYFEHFNIFYALFEAPYNFQSRSFLVKIAILASGLTLLSNDEKSKHLLSYLVDIIQSKIRMSSFKPNFETLQFLLVVLVGFRLNPPICNFFHRILGISLSIAEILGLRIICFTDKPKRNIEKVLAYKTLMFFSGYTSLLTFPFNSQGTGISSTCSNLDIGQIRFQSNLRGFSRDKIFSNIGLIFNDFLYSFNFTLGSLSNLKASIVVNKCTYSQLEIISKKLTIRNDAICLKYHSRIGELEFLLLENPDKVFSSLFFSLKITIRVFCHYMRFFLLSLRFYLYSHTTEPINILKTSDPTFSQQKTTELAKQEALETVSLAYMIPQQFIFDDLVSIVAQCLSFLVQNNLDQLSKTTIYKGFLFLDSLKANSRLNSLAGFNKVLTSEIGKFFSSDL